MAGISVVSCVNDFQRYNSCVRSSFEEEQRTGTVEVIPVDNTSNSLSAPMALNRGLEKAVGKIIVFCHQDVIFPQGWISRLYEQISTIEKTHNSWGVLGTFGVTPSGKLAGHVIDWKGHAHCLPLPVEVQSLDEHCLIVRKDSGLAFDEDLGGFHFYGADICLEALTKGLTNFAVDACVQHLSPGGKVDTSFYEAMDKLYQKWKTQNPPLSVIETTCKVCRLKSGFTGRIAYEIARFKRKRRRKRLRKSREAGMEYRSLRHDAI